MTIQKVISKSALSLQPSRPVTDFNDIYVRQSIQDLFDSLAHVQAEIDKTRPEVSGGVGLAANQLEYPQPFYPADFIPYNIYVVNVRPLRAQLEGCPAVEPSVYINASFTPMISAQTDNVVLRNYMEGCLSIAGINSPVVSRVENIFLTYADSNGMQQTMPLNGFIARVHQHEIDHGAGREFLNQLTFSDQELREIAHWLVNTDKDTVKPGDWIIRDKLLIYFLPADYKALSAWVSNELQKLPALPSIRRINTDNTLFGARSPSAMTIASPIAPPNESEVTAMAKLKIT